MFESSAPKERSVRVTTSHREYSIVMRGTADMDNTTTRYYETFEIGFQPNISLTIENTGKTPVVNPRVVTNGKRRWWCMEELLDEILAGAANDQEKALLTWDYVRRHRHHDYPIFADDELHDPVKMLCVFGAGLCDDSGSVGCSLLYHAGLNREKHGRDPKVRCLHGHMMCEAYLDGDYQFLDIDGDTFYLDRENERPVSGDALAHDHDLAKREHAFGPIFKGWQTGQQAASLFGSDDGETFRAAAGHRIDMTLRPGEKIVYRWDNVGKFASDGKWTRQFWGNSLHVFSPRLGGDEHEGSVHSSKDIEPVEASGTARLAGTSRDASVTYEMQSPYAACGGRVHARFVGLCPRDRFQVSVSLDGEAWRRVWRQSGKGTTECQVDLDKYLEVKKGPPKYRYLVRVSLGSAAPNSAQLAALTIETDLMTSPHSLPRLGLGRNQVVYTDETKEPHEVVITHCWQESGNVTPPKPPARPTFPKHNSLVRASRFELQWPAVPDAVRYHIRVSRYPDLKLPYRPCFDTVIESNSHGSPFTGLFSPDEDYYWRVRPQNGEGVWGEWSRVWHFRWDGPRVPVNVRSHIKGGEIMITWEPNPRGPRPVCYDVYGSDERGFSVSKQPYYVKGLGEQPSNSLARTTDAKLLVVSASADRPNMNKSFYRVVAIDQNGTESGCSDYVELPHPYLYSKPVKTAVAGKPYRYELKILRSIGDLQYRYRKPNQQFWEREEYEFELVQGPKWLKLDPKKGVLSGVPSAKDMGTASVEILVCRLHPHEVSVDEKAGDCFQKTAPEFQARHRQKFRIRVQSTQP